MNVIDMTITMFIIFMVNLIRWTGMIAELRSQKADMAVIDMSVTSIRQTAVDFTMPFMSTGVRTNKYEMAIEERQRQWQRQKLWQRQRTKIDMSVTSIRQTAVDFTMPFMSTGVRKNEYEMPMTWPSDHVLFICFTRQRKMYHLIHMCKVGILFKKKKPPQRQRHQQWQKLWKRQRKQWRHYLIHTCKVGILYKKKTPPPPNPFSFLQPLSIEVIILALIVIHQHHLNHLQPRICQYSHHHDHCDLDHRDHQHHDCDDDPGVDLHNNGLPGLGNHIVLSCKNLSLWVGWWRRGLCYKCEYHHYQCLPSVQMCLEMMMIVLIVVLITFTTVIIIKITLLTFLKKRCGQYQMLSGLALAPSLVRAATFFLSITVIILSLSSHIDIFIFYNSPSFDQHSSFVPKDSLFI